MRRCLLRRLCLLGISLGLLVVLAGCGAGAGGGGGGGATNSSNNSDPALTITTNSLPSGVVNTTYSAGLGASGGRHLTTGASRPALPCQRD